MTGSSCASHQPYAVHVRLYTLISLDAKRKRHPVRAPADRCLAGQGRSHGKGILRRTVCHHVRFDDVSLSV